MIAGLTVWYPSDGSKPPGLTILAGAGFIYVPIRQSEPCVLLYEHRSECAFRGGTVEKLIGHIELVLSKIPIPYLRLKLTQGGMLSLRPAPMLGLDKTCHAVGIARFHDHLSVCSQIGSPSVRKRMRLFYQRGSARPSLSRSSRVLPILSTETRML